MITLFLATVIGWYLIIVGLFLLIRPELAKTVTLEVMEHSGTLFMIAIITLILGLLLVASHNLWIMGWPVAITVFSWLVLIGGLVRLFYPELTLKMGKTFLENPIKMKISAVVTILIGLFFLAHVYYF
jgi:hypothetical protein